MRILGVADSGSQKKPTITTTTPTEPTEPHRQHTRTEPTTTTTMHYSSSPKQWKTDSAGDHDNNSNTSKPVLHRRFLNKSVTDQLFFSRSKPASFQMARGCAGHTWTLFLAWCEQFAKQGRSQGPCIVEDHCYCPPSSHTHAYTLARTQARTPRHTPTGGLVVVQTSLDDDMCMSRCHVDWEGLASHQQHLPDQIRTCELSHRCP